mmetsp:Transcript_146679/g.381259  ORF Transcript_146679/g.381259 Transcript_146679/m.381259 type:complete len:115 (+) Transcript_146679:362-706(+)
MSTRIIVALLGISEHLLSQKALLVRDVELTSASWEHVGASPIEKGMEVVDELGMEVVDELDVDELDVEVVEELGAEVGGADVVDNSSGSHGVHSFVGASLYQLSSSYRSWSHGS